MNWIYDDGGRADSGRKGDTRDCVCRAIAIAADLPYAEVYERLAEGNATQQRGKREPAGKAGKRTASRGINTTRKWFKDYMQSLNFDWKATMTIGSGCKVHLHPSELPKKGRLVLSVSRHLVAMIDGIIHDTYDCSRSGTRCVYGYWKKND